MYRDIETLKEYILIDSEKIMVEKFTKNEDKSWTLTEYFNLDTCFEIKSIDVKIFLSDLYDGVKDVSDSNA